MLIIGLTGGIGSGKSVAAEYFNNLGVPIIDADVLAHQLMISGQSAFQDIINSFGTQVLTSNGDLNRSLLRQLIFSNSFARMKLETILHPRIRISMQLQLNELYATPYAIIVVPLLFEARFNDLCHRVLIVDVPEAIQIERVQRRNGYTVAEIRAILDNQWTREQRLAATNDIIDNGGNLTQLYTQINVLHEYYLSLGINQCLSKLIPLNTH